MLLNIGHFLITVIDNNDNWCGTPVGGATNLLLLQMIVLAVIYEVQSRRARRSQQTSSIKRLSISVSRILLATIVVAILAQFAIPFLVK
jgi:hypothetical protein